MSSQKIKDIFKGVLETTQETSPAVVSVESLNLSYLEVDGARKDLEDCYEVIDSLENFVTTFDSISNYVESKAEGSLTDSESGVLKIAVEGFNKQLGIETDRVVSVESLKDTIKKMWEAIKRAVTQAIELVQEYFRKVYDYMYKFSLWRKESEKKLKSKEVDTKAEIDPIYLERLSYKGKFDINSIVEGLQELSKACDLIKGPYFKAIKDYYDTVERLWNDNAVRTSASPKEINDAIVESKIKADKILFEALKSLDQKEFICSKKFELLPVKEDGIVQNKVSEFNLLPHKPRSEEKISAPSTDELIKLLLKSQDIVDCYYDFKKVLDDYHGLKKKAFRAGDKLIQDVSNNRLSVAWDDGLTRSALKLVYKRTVDPIHQFSSHTIFVTRAVQKLVEESTK